MQAPADAESGLLESHRYIGEEPPKQPEQLEPVITESLRRETTLRAIMQGGKMEPRYAMRLWVSILKALGQRHKEGIYPGGLSPEGIFIDADNNVRFAESQPLNPPYQAPDQNRPDTGLVNPSPDIYSMGIILYEMLTGGRDGLGVGKPSEAAPDVPSWLDEITLRCVNKDRERRFGSLDEIFAALRELTKKSE